MRFEPLSLSLSLSLPPSLSPSLSLSLIFDEITKWLQRSEIEGAN